MATKDEKLIEAARKALNITNPVYRIEVDNATVTFYLCGHIEPLVWTKPTRKPKGAVKAKA